MTKMNNQIPTERKRQFDLIEIATKSMLKWASDNNKSLVHIYPVVPFVETDFSLDAWLFLDTESRINEYKNDGTADVLASRFLTELENAGYPEDWLQSVSCHFGSKEKVDRDYKGNYYHFLR